MNQITQHPQHLHGEMPPPTPTMTGSELARIREGLSLTRVQFGNRMGYSGNWNTVNDTVKRYENGRKPIPWWIATMARALDTDGLLSFIQNYRGRDDQAEFARHLSRWLVTGEPSRGN